MLYAQVSRTSGHLVAINTDEVAEAFAYIESGDWQPPTDPVISQTIILRDKYGLDVDVKMGTVNDSHTVVDLTTDELIVRTAIAEHHQTGEGLPESVARTIAAWWQSPGRGGHEMARFATTGTITDAATWQRDFNLTYTKALSSSDRTEEQREFDRRALEALSLFVLRNVSFEPDPHLYAITARTETRNGAYTGSIDSPTFYLDANVQGIISKDHAAAIVKRWLTDVGLNVLDVTAVPVES